MPEQLYETWARQSREAQTAGILPLGQEGHAIPSQYPQEVCKPPEPLAPYVDAEPVNMDKAF